MADLKPYEAGYMKPPKQHRFQPGTSGNPKGRPKRVEDPYAALQKVLSRRITVKGHARRMRLREALFRRLRELALAGDRRALDLQQKILQVATAAQPPEPREMGTAKRRAAELLGLHLQGQAAEAADVDGR